MKISMYILEYAEKRLPSVFLRFMMGGVAGFTFTILITYFLTYIAGLNYFMSYILALSATIIFNFILTIKYVFRVQEKYATRFAKYAFVVGVFYLINLLLVRLAVESLHIHYILSITIITVCMYAAKFYIYDTYIFSQKMTQKKDRKSREKELHSRLTQEYEHRQEGTKNGRYYSKEWLRHMIHLSQQAENARILDVGCGTGILYEVINEENMTCVYTGIDLSEEMLAIGRKRYMGIDLQVMDCENLLFQNNSFDLIFMRGVLHHLPDSINAIREMERVCKKDGFILISEPAKNFMTKIPRILSKRLTTHFDEEHTDFSLHDLKLMLSQVNINNVEFNHFGYLAYPWGFPDLIPGAKCLPLSILKALLKIDLILAKLPLINRISWHIIVMARP